MLLRSSLLAALPFVSAPLSFLYRRRRRSGCCSRSAIFALSLLFCFGCCCRVARSVCVSFLCTDLVIYLYVRLYSLTLCIVYQSVDLYLLLFVRLFFSFFLSSKFQSFLLTFCSFSPSRARSYLLFFIGVGEYRKKENKQKALSKWGQKVSNVECIQRNCMFISSVPEKEKKIEKQNQTTCNYIFVYVSKRMFCFKYWVRSKCMNNRNFLMHQSDLPYAKIAFESTINSLYIVYELHT